MRNILVIATLLVMAACEQQPPNASYIITAYDAETNEVLRVFKNVGRWCKSLDWVDEENFRGRKWLGTYWVGQYWTPLPLMRPIRFERTKQVK